MREQASTADTKRAQPVAETFSDEQWDIQWRLTSHAQETYKLRGERGALRCGLGDATALCDWLVGQIERENRGRNGKGAVTKRGRELAAIAKRCADAIHAMRDFVHAPPPTEER